MPTTSGAEIYIAKSIPDAIRALEEHHTRVIAGATWIMRNPLRGEAYSERYVSLGEIQELKAIDIAEADVCIGAGVTHAELAERLVGIFELRSLWQAAVKSANPAIRAAATIGGNLCAADFCAPDLTTAFLSLSAEIEIVVNRETITVPINRFLEIRSALPRPSIVLAVHIRRTGRVTAHERLPLRVAGDYPVAIVSVAIDPNQDSDMPATIAVGSVEAVPRRWISMEDCWRKSGISSTNVKEFASQFSEEFTGRDSVEAPGWYRTSVLPTLLERAVRDVESQLANAGGNT